MLWRALREGELSVRLAVAQVLAQAGRPKDIEPLRTALADADPLVAGEALEALAEISERYDLRIE
jgi:HEAT repeat protein